MDKDKEGIILKLKKLRTFKNSPLFAIFDLLQDLNDKLDNTTPILKGILDKEYPEPLPPIPFPEIPPFPEFPKIPEPKEVDLSEVVSLLKKILDKEPKKEDVVVKLEIE